MPPRRWPPASCHLPGVLCSKACADVCGRLLTCTDARVHFVSECAGCTHRSACGFTVHVCVPVSVHTRAHVIMLCRSGCMCGSVGARALWVPACAPSQVRVRVGVTWGLATAPHCACGHVLGVDPGVAPSVTPTWRATVPPRLFDCKHLRVLHLGAVALSPSPLLPAAGPAAWTHSSDAGTLRSGDTEAASPPAPGSAPLPVKGAMRGPPSVLQGSARLEQARSWHEGLARRPLRGRAAPRGGGCLSPPRCWKCLPLPAGGRVHTWEGTASLSRSLFISLGPLLSAGWMTLRPP